MSYEDEFDANLRELFMISLVHVASLTIATRRIVWRRRRPQVDEDEDDNGLGQLLTCICLCFAQTSLLVVPLNELILCLPAVSQWMGIDGARLSAHFSLVSIGGAQLSLLVLNPLAYLVLESTQVGLYSSLLTASTELALVLSMMVCLGGCLLLDDDDDLDVLRSPGVALTRLYSVGVHTPGWALFLVHAPRGMVALICDSLDGFVVDTSGEEEEEEEDVRRRRAREAQQERIELQQMKRWGGGGSQLVTPLASSSSPPDERVRMLLLPAHWHNLVALLRLVLVLLLTCATLVRLVLPSKFFADSRGGGGGAMFKTCPQLLVLFAAHRSDYRVAASSPFLRMCAMLVFALASPLVLGTLFGLLDALPRVSHSSHDAFRRPSAAVALTACFLLAFALSIHRHLRPKLLSLLARHLHLHHHQQQSV